MTAPLPKFTPGQLVKTAWNKCGIIEQVTRQRVWVRWAHPERVVCFSRGEAADLLKVQP